MFYQLVSLGILHIVFHRVSNSVMHHSILAVEWGGGGIAYVRQVAQGGNGHCCK